MYLVGAADDFTLVGYAYDLTFVGVKTSFANCINVYIHGNICCQTGI